MIRQYPNLCKPIKLGNVIYRNRMFCAPMGATDVTADCSVGARSVGFYELRAWGGAANVTVSELVVDPATDASHMLHLSEAVPGQLASFTYTADAIRRHGAVPTLELSHSGMYAGTYILDKETKGALPQYGPSEAVRPDGKPVKALSVEQIHGIVASYGRAAALAKKAGFESLLVHAGHGWLLNQFISPYFNHREDEYGGSFEGRMKIVREVLAEVRAAVGPGFPIELRMSGAELFDGGYDLAYGCEIAHHIEDLVDIIHVSAGSYQFGFSITHPSMFREHGCNVYLAEEIKKHVSIPVGTIGGLSDPKMMDELIGSGKVDVVIMARELLADPEFPRKVAANRGDETVRCLRCFVCMAERAVTGTRRCTINPRIGRECEGFEVVPATRSKKVLVAGGGVGGLKAAITAAERGHRVILCEKSGECGGILKSEQAIDFKYEMYELGVKLTEQALREGVDIRLNTEVTPEYVEAEAPDALIIAVGSEPLGPGLPGLHGDNVVVVNEYYREKDKVTSPEVVVFGGGLAGCECAVHLAHEGKKVHLVEMRSMLAPDANIRHRPILLKEIADCGIQVHTEHTGLRVTAEGIVCRNKDGEEVLVPGADVICALGQRARVNVADSLKDSAPFVRTIGDCVRPANICTAIYQGYHAALDI